MGVLGLNPGPVGGVLPLGVPPDGGGGSMLVSTGRGGAGGVPDSPLDPSLPEGLAEPVSVMT